MPKSLVPQEGLLQGASEKRTLAFWEAGRIFHWACKKLNIFQRGQQQPERHNKLVQSGNAMAMHFKSWNHLKSCPFPKWQLQARQPSVWFGFVVWEFEPLVLLEGRRDSPPPNHRFGKLTSENSQASKEFTESWSTKQGAKRKPKHFRGGGGLSNICLWVKTLVPPNPDFPLSNGSTGNFLFPAKSACTEDL